ncbi:class I SAM-dependent methyltransferase [Candidatus Woesearchaeota archaeon]|nr:class I SAM-dependent methyltransferase [Candidatus Woesearchaeota archaeon]
MIETLLNKTEFKPSDIVLELAAGTGIATKHILKKPFAKLYVTDNSKDMLDQAKHNILDPISLRTKLTGIETVEESYFREVFDSRLTKDKEIEFIPADVYILSYTYDLMRNFRDMGPHKIILTNALNSLERPIKALGEIYSLLAPHGELLFNCKLVTNKKTLRDVINNVIIEEDMRLDKLNVPHKFFPDNTDILPRYSKEEIENMLQEAGFIFCCSEEQEIHLDQISAINYLHKARERINAVFDMGSDPTRKELKNKIDSLFYYNAYYSSIFPSLLKKEGFFVAKKE